MNLLDHSRGRMFLFALLYVAEGAPIGFIWLALPTMLRQRDFSLEQIGGLTSVLILPWVFKFLWAPLVDALRTARFGFRGWIMSAQAVMGLALLPLIWLDPSDHFPWWTGLLLVHALAAATQDVAIDALAIRAAPPAERGRLNGFMQAGMLLGRSVFSGGALWLAHRAGMGVAVMLLVGWIWISLGVLVLVREPVLQYRGRMADHWRVFGVHLAQAARQRNTWLGLAFALTAAAAFELAGLMAGPYLNDHGASPDQVAGFFTVGAVGAPLLGGLLGGLISDRWGRRRSLAVYLTGFCAWVLVLACLDGAGTGPGLGWLIGVWIALYFFIGLFTAASYALFMEITDPRLGATQFSAYMAATNGCESWVGRVGSGLAERGGYALGFAAMCLVSLGSLIFLAPIRPKREDQTSRTAGRTQPR